MADERTVEPFEDQDFAWIWIVSSLIALLVLLVVVVIQGVELVGSGLMLGGFALMVVGLWWRGEKAGPFVLAGAALGTAGIAYLVLR